MDEQEFTEWLEELMREAVHGKFIEIRYMGLVTIADKVAALRAENSRLQARVDELEEQVAAMRPVVDAALSTCEPMPIQLALATRNYRRGQALANKEVGNA